MNLSDRIEQISATIGELRAFAADGPKSRQLIDSLFRTVHSFKAAASIEGRDDLSRTAHEFENLLHSLRTGKLKLDDEVLQAIDRAAAALRDGSSLQGLSQNVNHTSKSDLLPPEFANLKDDERHRATEAMREGSNLYVLKAEFDVNDFDERFRRLKEQLQKNAEPISTSASMEDDKIIFQVVYASPSEKIPAQTVLQQAIRTGQSVAAKLNKQVEFVIHGEEIVLLDRQLSDVLTDALVHLIRNAVDHGIESQGRVSIELRTSPDKLRIFVTDNGRGIDPVNLPLLFQPGFSTATEVSEISGRGVGLDAVKSEIEAVGGAVNVMSKFGKGTSFVISLPNPSSDA
ncbi:MAG TPA: ATP-binding protein [Pyrinomonadaceae bacterium]|nr:ATP-binding protein [Pyrinomonadaceae bacterium]